MPDALNRSEHTRAAAIQAAATFHTKHDHLTAKDILVTAEYFAEYIRVGLPDDDEHRELMGFYE